MPSSKLLADVLSGWGACDEPTESRSSVGEKRRARSASLAQTIEAEVIPRLMLAHRRMGSFEPARQPEKPGPDDVVELVRLVLEHDGAIATHFVETVRSRGMASETIYLDLLAPAARLLGEMWKADLCDFADVSVGLSRLQHVFHEMTACPEEDLTPRMTGQRVLLLPLPGEQHTFGIMVVEEFFRRAGWECCTAMPQTPAEVTKLVRKEHFDVVGISLSSEFLVERVAPCIHAIRKASRNKALPVVVGGSVFNDHPDYVSRVGADFGGVDGRQAVLQLGSVFDKHAVRSK